MINFEFLNNVILGALPFRSMASDVSEKKLHFFCFNTINITDFTVN